MAERRVLLWTGGRPGSEECRESADVLRTFALPPPDQLQPSAHIEYFWGDRKFDILAIACSVRTTPWGSESMTWLHCKAMTIPEIAAGKKGVMNVLIPAHYVIGIQAGPIFHLSRSRLPEDIGVFPPNQPTPLLALPLAEVERVLVELMVAERN